MERAMIAYWMLYCTAVGALAGCGALALERALRPLGRATRWAWAIGMLLTLAIPAATRFVPRLRPAPAVAPQREMSPERSASFSVLPRKQAPLWDAARLDGPLSVAWGASSGAVALALGGMVVALRNRRRQWACAEVDGVSVLVSGDTGPAVVGLLRSRIVLPRWAVEGDAEARRLVLEHEREHVRAGDPRLLAAGLIVVALMPWNPAVWWQLRRLRLAVEVDCDARVLRRRGDVRAYGAVLLEVGRRIVHSRLAAAAFAEPVSSLERRIRIMTAPRVRRPLVRAAVFGALAAALAVAACEAPAPTQPGPSGTRSLYRAPGAEASFPRIHLTPQSAIATYFPDVARNGLGANEVLLFVISPQGGVVRHERFSGANEADKFRQATASIDTKTIATVDVMKLAEGLAPTPVSLVWVVLKGPEEAPARVSIDRAAPAGREGEAGFYVQTIAGSAVARTGSGPSTQAMVAARDRFFTPEMAEHGPHGQMRIRYRFDASGNPTDLRVTATPAELEPVARQIAAAIDLGHGTPNTEAQAWMTLGSLPRQPAGR